MKAVAVELDALGDTRRLWADWVESSAAVLDVSPEDVPEDRAEAARILDGHGGNWRTLLERFCEDRAPAYLRRDAVTSAALRRLSADGGRVGVFTDAPAELATVALAQLGAARRIEALETGSDALARLLGRLGGEAAVVRTRDELRAAAESG